MKSIPIGWEGDRFSLRFKDNTKTKTYPILKPIIIRGFQIDVAMMPVWDRNIELVQVPGGAQVLAWGMFSNQPACDEFGEPVLHDDNNQIHGSGVGSGCLFSLILKTWVTGSGEASCVNKGCSLSGMDWRVRVPCELTLFMGHTGFMCDAEMQGAIYYERLTAANA